LAIKTADITSFIFFCLFSFYLFFKKMAIFTCSFGWKGKGENEGNIKIDE
jgi:hypothetical protein